MKPKEFFQLGLLILVFGVLSFFLSYIPNYEFFKWISLLFILIALVLFAIAVYLRYFKKS
jgi:hypothetical protein